MHLKSTCFVHPKMLHLHKEGALSQMNEFSLDSAFNFLNIVQEITSSINEQGAVEKIRCSFSIKVTTTKWIESALDTMLAYLFPKMTLAKCKICY